MSVFLSREMQRGLPAVRTVSIPYHGMTIPIPSNNSFYSPTTPTNSNQTAVQNMSEESSPISHQIKNTTSNEAEVCNGGKDTPTPAPAIADSPMLPMTSTACSPLPCSPMPCSPMPCSPMPCSPMPSTAHSPMLLPMRSTACSPVPHSPSPPKSPWLHTGRGRALQQLVSQISPGVGRRHSAMPTTSGAASPAPPGTGLSNLCISAGQEDDPVINTLMTGIAEDYDRNADDHDPNAATGNSSDHDLSASTGNADDHALDVQGSVKDLNPALSARQVEPTVDIRATGSTENHDIDTGTSAQSDKASSPEDVAKVDDAKVEVADHVIETKAKPLPASLTLQSPSCTAAPILTPSPGKTTRSPRKSRISLAIQFKGVCLSPQSVQEVGDKSTTTPWKSPGELALGRFTAQQSTTPTSSSGKTSTGDVEAKIQLHKNADVTLQTMKSGENERKFSSSGSEDEVLTQVSEEEFEGCGPVSLSSMPPLLSDSSEGEREGEVGMKERVEFPDGVSSDEEGEGELEGARMGLTAAQLEMSISLHQRNTHRNGVETKRIQRRIQGTEEVLAADLAEQCAEDTFNYNITHGREQEMARVLDLQVQFDAQSIEKTSFADEKLFHLDPENHDKLMQMELKHEVEAQEVEEQLQLVRKQSALLQAKSEMTV